MWLLGFTSQPASIIRSDRDAGKGSSSKEFVGVYVCVCVGDAVEGYGNGLPLYAAAAWRSVQGNTTVSSSWAGR